MSDLNYEYKYWMPAVARWIKINCDASISEDVSLSRKMFLAWELKILSQLRGHCGSGRLTWGP